MRLRVRPLWQFARPLLVPVVLLVLAVFTLREPVLYWLYGEEHFDREALREWLREATVFETLPDLAGSYAQLRERQEQLQRQQPQDQEALRAVENRLRNKRDELTEHLKALGDPLTKIYPGRLVLFPVIYQMTVHFDKRLGLEPVTWDSGRPLHPGQYKELAGPPRPDGRGSAGVPLVVDRTTGTALAWVDVRYRLRVYATQQYKEREDVQRRFRLGALAVVFATVALFWFYLAQRQQRERERQRLAARQQVIEAEQQRLQEELKRREAERKQQEAEHTALELKSQLFANIGIMAGSYAHNIKNLLVRPNDLLGRCLDRADIPGDEESMLREVRQTLGTVTERLQQILQTVRRDPNRSEAVRLDLNQLSADLLRGWEFLAGEKWKLTLRLEPAPEPLWIEGDASHLQQALENLLFNARDATFEMRKHLRDEARAADAAMRKQALIVAAAWKGEITVRTRRAGDLAVLEVTDNGVGMTEEVRQRCMETHFSTKRNNALFEGMTAGMGLGLSFVQVILDHHGARLEIESQPLRGATFRVRFPLAQSQEQQTTHG